MIKNQWYVVLESKELKKNKLIGNGLGDLVGSETSSNLIHELSKTYGSSLNEYKMYLGDEPYNYTYGDMTSGPIALNYEICGFKLNDDTGAPIEGWTIHLDKWNGAVWQEDFVVPVETDANGKYCFTDLPEGKYKVREDIEYGWEQVYPEGGGHIVNLPNDSMIYGIQRTTGKIFEVDPLNPMEPTLFQQIDVELLNRVFTGTSPNGIAYDQETGDIYFATYPAISKLYKIEDGVQRDLGTLIGSVASGEIYNGKYYYIADTTDDLYVVSFKEDGTIDTITPHLNISDGASAWYFGDIVVDHVEGVIYGEGQSGKQQFFKVNLDGLGYQLIQSYFGNLLQLAIGTDNVIYAHSAYNGDFYTIDRATGLVETVAYGDNQYTDISFASVCYYNFRNRPLYSIAGTKYGVDYNDNETPLAGWKITLEKFDDDVWVPVDETITGPNGMYCFDELISGTYRLTESYGSMNSDGYWEFGDKFYKPVEVSGESQIVELSGETASDCDVEPDDENAMFYNFYNACFTDETAWAFGDIALNTLDNLTANNWGWSITVTTSGAIGASFDQPIYAGAGQNDISKGHLIGNVHIEYVSGSMPTYDIDLLEEEGIDEYVRHVWIGKTELPLDKNGNFTNAPGQLNKIIPFDYNLETPIYMAIHLGVYVPCEYTNAGQ